MASGGHWTVLLLLCTIPGSIFAKERGGYRQKDAADSLVQAPPAGLSVLLLTTGDAGHVIVMATLGATLVQRGHRVTLSTPLREGNTRPQDLAEKYGMSYESNGVDPHPTQEAVLNHHAYLHENGFLVNAYDAAWYASRHIQLASEFLPSWPYPHVDGSLQRQPHLFPAPGDLLHASSLEHHGRSHFPKFYTSWNRV